MINPLNLTLSLGSKYKIKMNIIIVLGYSQQLIHNNLDPLDQTQKHLKHSHFVSSSLCTVFHLNCKHVSNKKNQKYQPFFSPENIFFLCSFFFSSDLKSFIFFSCRVNLNMNDDVALKNKLTNWELLSECHGKPSGGWAVFWGGWQRKVPWNVCNVLYFPCVFDWKWCLLLRGDMQDGTVGWKDLFSLQINCYSLSYKKKQKNNLHSALFIPHHCKTNGRRSFCSIELFGPGNNTFICKETLVS